MTDLVYIPLLGLSEIDFYAKVVVNAFLAVGLASAGRRWSPVANAQRRQVVDSIRWLRRLN